MNTNIAQIANIGRSQARRRARARSVVVGPATAALLVALTSAAPALAGDVAPAPDNGISAHDLRTGALRWANDELEVGNASLTLREDGLEVVDVRSGAKTAHGVDPSDGTSLDATPTGAALASSRPGWLRQHHLERGWRLDHSPGNEQELRFVDDAGEVRWTVDTGEYAHAFATLGACVYTAQDYLARGAVVRAWCHEEGVERTTAPAWERDLDAWRKGAGGVSVDAPTLTRVTLWPVTDELVLAQVHTSVFLLSAREGTVTSYSDLAAALGLVESDFYIAKTGIEHATVALGDGVAVIAWDRRVVALDQDGWLPLWTMDTDTHPHASLPLVHEGVVYLSTGGGRSTTLVDASADP